MISKMIDEYVRLDNRLYDVEKQAREWVKETEKVLAKHHFVIGVNLGEKVCVDEERNMYYVVSVIEDEEVAEVYVEQANGEVVKLVEAERRVFWDGVRVLQKYVKKQECICHNRKYCAERAEKAFLRLLGKEWNQEEFNK